MTRVEMDDHGRRVVIDHEGELEPIRQAAASLWELMQGPEPSLGPAVGFTSERRGFTDVPPIGRSNRNRGCHPPRHVDASGDTDD